MQSQKDLRFNELAAELREVQDERDSLMDEVELFQLEVAQLKQ